ncbi:hypothetical protein [Streptomyces sp. CA-111067]|uniref:hypothetical protein n=1 Tax=Streptomyces sp. CA-111067 TaxID=3240046 RepID=UPI003D988EE4
MAVLGMVAGLVAAAAVWRQSVRSGQRLGAGMGCLLLGGVVFTLLVGGWVVLVVLSGSDLGLTTP